MLLIMLTILDDLYAKQLRLSMLCIIIKVNDTLFIRIGYFKEITSKTNQGTTYTTLNCKTIILKSYL